MPEDWEPRRIRIPQASKGASEGTKEEEEKLRKREEEWTSSEKREEEGRQQEKDTIAVAENIRGVIGTTVGTMEPKREEVEERLRTACPEGTLQRMFRQMETGKGKNSNGIRKKNAPT